MNEEFTVNANKVYQAYIEPCPTSPWQYEYVLKDHLGNYRVVFTDDSSDPGTSPDILQVSHYSPFGMELVGEWQNSNKQDFNYLYNGKELHKDFGFSMLNYGARFYDPSIGRFLSVDPLAGKRTWMNPYNYVQNNPVLRIDPNGLTDYLVSKSGEITKFGKDNDDKTDRILKTDKDGNIKRKGEGFLVKKSERGKPKVAVKNIHKGILKEGMNLRTNNSLFQVNGEGQPTLKEFDKFISQFSDYVGLEIAGIRLGEANSDKVSSVKVNKYKRSERKKSYVPKIWFKTFAGRIKSHFHTHPGSDEKPSDDDEFAKSLYPNIKFFIITGGNEVEY